MTAQVVIPYRRRRRQYEHRRLLDNAARVAGNECPPRDAVLKGADLEREFHPRAAVPQADPRAVAAIARTRMDAAPLIRVVTSVRRVIENLRSLPKIDVGNREPEAGPLERGHVTKSDAETETTRLLRGELEVNATIRTRDTYAFSCAAPQ